MLRGCFCCDLSSQGLGKFHNFDRFGLGQMLDVDLGSCFIGNHDITRHHAVFGNSCRSTNVKMLFSHLLIEAQDTIEVWVFLMKAEQNIMFFGQFHGLSKDTGIGQRNPIIRKGYSTISQQGFKIGDMFAIKFLGNGCHSMDTDIFLGS